MTVKLTSSVWEFDVHVWGDGTSTSVTFDLLKLPLGLDYSVGLWSSVQFVEAYSPKKSGAPLSSVWATPSLNGTDLTLTFYNNGSPTPISSGVRMIYVLQGVQ